MRLKPIVRTLHRASALIAGIPLIVLSITGALLVFPDPFERAVHGDRVADPTDPTIRPPSELIAAARTVLPDNDRVIRIQYPSATGDTIVVRTKDDRAVVLDPATARVLRVVEPDGFELGRFLVRLHTSLLVGEVGTWITGTMSVALVLLICTGSYLWWPRGRWARQYFKVKFTSGKSRLIYDLHRASGLYCSIPLFLIAVTGAAMAFYSFTVPAVVIGVGTGNTNGF